MISFNVDRSLLPFDIYSKLEKFENDFYEELKRLLNTSYRNITVRCILSLEEWKGDPLVVKSNASESIEGSLNLLEAINSYLSTKDELEPILTNITLFIKLNLNKKKVEEKTGPNQAPKAKNKEEESAPDYLPMKPRYTFDQMILDDKIRQEVFDAIKVIECKELIYSKWGFADVDPIPRSIINFYGEPGTGKTMCAHAIANNLGKTILALNYAEIESKFVGEAPKNLQKAFDVAKQTDSVLFFDEADSFLGKRIENVTQGADQALNSLRSQMLILLEEFSGVVIFATNLVTNFDPAFESRILKHIRFELPNQEARAAMIRKMIPSKLPVDHFFTDEEVMEASKIIDGFNGREIKGAILDCLLSKADPSNQDVVFTVEDFYAVFKKKKQAKIDLKKEEEKRVKDKISKKLKEKAEENKALREQEEADAAAKDKEMTEENSEISEEFVENADSSQKEFEKEN